MITTSVRGGRWDRWSEGAGQRWGSFRRYEYGRDRLVIGIRLARSER